MIKLFKRSLSLIVAIVVLAVSCLSAFAAADGIDGKTYNYYIKGDTVTVTVGNEYYYAGYSGVGAMATHHYRINDRTAYCVWAANGEATPVTKTLTKYCMYNKYLRPRVFYYMSWASSASEPDKSTTGYYNKISSDFLTAYKKTIFAKYTTLTKNSTYQDAMVAALTYISKRTAEIGTGETVGTNGAYQYCLAHALLDYAQQKVHHGATGWAYKEAIEELYTLCDSLPDVPAKYRVFYCYPAGKNEQSLMSIEVKEGGAEIQKTSSNPELTDNNSCYSLEGAVYTIYKNAACTSKYGTITTDENGFGSLENMEAGTYYVKETKAPKGYALDENVYTITVTEGETAVLSVTDNPQADPVAVMLQKRNATTGEETDVRLAGAEYTFCYYNGFYSTEEELEGVAPNRSWVLKTDENGRAQLDEEWKVSGDNFYLVDSDEDGVFETPILPLGTLTIKESKAPEGFYLDETVYIQQITSEGQDVFVNTYNTPISDEYEIPTRDIKVVKEWDDDNNRDGMRPSKLTYKLLVNGEVSQTIAVDESTNWSYTFTDLYETDVDYNEYVYTVEEEAVDNYTTTVSEQVYDETNDVYVVTINNYHEPIRTELTFNKIWEDFQNCMNYRPDSITVNLLANDIQIDSKKITSDDGWKGVFTNLYVYENGEVIDYSITEEKVDGYNTTINGTDIINTLITGSITLFKGDSADTMLEGVKFELYTKNGDKVYCSENSGVFSFSGTSSAMDNYTNEFVTNENGEIFISNLPYGEYYFKETSTLEGYMPYEDKINFTISYENEDTLNPDVSVINNKVLMYNTGGAGNTVIYIIAIVVGLIAVSLLAFYITKNKRKKEKSE